MTDTIAIESSIFSVKTKKSFIKPVLLKMKNNAVKNNEAR